MITKQQLENAAQLPEQGSPYTMYGKAPTYSRKVEAACLALKESAKALLETLKSEYPIGARVRVHHPRGFFYATVVGHSVRGEKVIVVNINSDKQSGRWVADVELA